MNDLFPISFIELIRTLKIRVGPMPVVGSHGEHRSHRIGSSVEFRDFQHYTPGHDFRRVDWNIYQRTGELFLRCYEFKPLLPVYVYIDLSSSMFFEENPRARIGLQTAAAIVSAALLQQDAVSIVTYGDGPGPQLRDVRGGIRLPHVLSFLSELKPMKHTNLAAGIRYLQAMAVKPGIAVILSDFLDVDAAGSVCESIAALHHRRVVLRIAQTHEIPVDLDGDFELLDCETGQSRKLVLTSEVKAMYQKNYDTFASALSETFQAQGARYQVLYADRPVIDQLGQLFPQGSLVI